MTMINKHGLPMVGLEAAAAETQLLPGTSATVQVSYDREDGQVLASWHADSNSYNVYQSPSIITIAHYAGATTAQEIADRIAHIMSIEEVAQ